MQGSSDRLGLPGKLLCRARRNGGDRKLAQAECEQFKPSIRKSWLGAVDDLLNNNILAACDLTSRKAVENKTSGT